jgi:hypothetical protein
MARTLDRKLAVEFIQVALPQFDEMLKDIEHHNGWVGVAEPLFKVMKNLTISNWPEAYLLESAKWRDMHACATLNLMMSKEEVTEFSSLFNASNDDEKNSIEEALIQDMTKAVQKDCDSLSEEQIAEEKEKFSNLSDVEKGEKIRQTQHCAISVITSFLNYLSLMVHGYRLTDLVQKAQTGSDDAFFMAIQIDRTLLVKLPYFAERFWRASVCGDSNFFEFLAYRLKNPTIRGQIRYHTLWLLFAMLDDMEILDRELANEDILTIYKSISESHVCRPIDDSSYVRKQRAKYVSLKRQTKLL